jgi:predicted phosphodiesterase
MKTKIVREYRDKHPKMPALSLARMIYKTFPETFINIESIRSIIRYIDGKSGAINRNKNKDKPELNRFYVNEDRPKNPFIDLPKSFAEKRKPVALKSCKVLFLSDIHIPYHENEPLTIALKKGIEDACNVIWLNGDTLDCYQLSSFEKDPKKRRFSDELFAVRQFLSELRRLFPDAAIFYKIGNHEERYWRYMRIKAPELLDVDALTFESLIHADKHNVQIINGKTKSNIGKLSVFHGHEFGASVFSPVNVARGLYMRAKASSICGHHHATSEHSERDVNDKIITTWSVGCLCELSPEYQPYNRWNHGFARIDVDASGDFNVRNYRIHNGKIL